MPDIVMTESIRSGSVFYGTDGTRSHPRIYDICNTTNKVDALMFALINAPNFDDGLPRRDINIDPKDGFEDAWEVTIDYSNSSTSEPPLVDIGDATQTFQVGSTNSRLFSSLKNISNHAKEGETAPDHNGAINVVEGQRVEGVEVQVPTYRFQHRQILDAATISGGYRATLFNAAGKVNGFPFMGFQVGEVRFLGATGSDQGDDKWELSYEFECLPNETSIEIGDIEPFPKEGWHYVWVEYEDQKDTESNTLVKVPVAAHVEQIYGYADLNTLGLSV